MKKVRRCFVDGEYGQLHVRSAGKDSGKPPIVCLHMVPKSSRSFVNLMPFLAEDRLVIAPDYPGYGESDPPPVAPEVDINDYARAVWGVIEQFELDEVSFVGYHTGSMVAVEAAQIKPQQVVKIINISAPVFTKEEVGQFHKYYAPIPLDVEGNRFRVMWERIMEYRGPGMTLEMAATSMAENLRGGENYEWGHRAAFNYTENYVANLLHLDQPILVMNIKDDLFKQSQRVDPLLKNGCRRDYTEWGTGFLDVYPEQVAKVMLKFLDRS